MNLEALKSTAVAMVGNGKGILAADESTPTCKKISQNTSGVYSQ